MKKAVFILVVIIVLSNLFFKTAALCQTIPVGFPVLDDYYRKMQLLGKVDSDISFTVRPINSIALKKSDIFSPDIDSTTDVGKVGSSFAHGKGFWTVLPFSLLQQFNSDHPYGWNDGPIIPARGYQTLISGGFYLKYGILSIQLRPEYVYAANPAFQGYVTSSGQSDLIHYYSYHNFIDNPERFGNGPYSKAFWGQSNISLTLGAVSIGLSSENVWWGPGIKNALIVSNNAPGFMHFTINTVKPIKTIIGTFEGQILAGKLDSSGYKPLSVTTAADGSNLLLPHTKDWRYFAGFNINYHPNFVPGLTLGLIRTFDAYYHDVKANGLSAYVPFFIPYSKQSTNSVGDAFPRDQYTSFYARYLLTKAQAEVYFEYGLNDNSYNVTDFIGSPEHSRAYIFGLRKMLPIGSDSNQHILFSGEITQLSQTVDRYVRNAGGWYMHTGVTQGQTNIGQVLGAGTGSGGNLQSLDISWISGLKMLGVSFDRYEHDMDFSQNVLLDINGNSRNWVDFAFGVFGSWTYKNFLFNTKIQAIKSLNYEWILKDYTPGMSYYIPNNTVYNLHAELGVTYRF